MMGVRSRRTVVVALGLAQTLNWASSYYISAVIADPVAAELGLSRDWFFGVFSAALLLSGLLGPLAGAAIDRHGRGVLVVASLVFATGLSLLAASSGLTSLALAWAVLGIGMGLGLYEAAFATLAGLYGREARGAITGITLIAGFASTVGWPATAFATELLGWRGACMCWAMLHLAVGLPLNLFLVPRARREGAASPQAAGEAPPAPRAMYILAGVFAACWFVSAAMAAHLPRMLVALGAAPGTAVLAAAMIGPAQVAARVMEHGLLSRFPPLVSAGVAPVLHPIGAGLLAVIGAPAATAFAILHGAGNGMLTIARGTLPLALFGPAGYGLRSGLIAAPARLLQGAAPLLFGLVLDRAGPGWALALSSTLTGLSFVALLQLRPPRKARAGKA